MASGIKASVGISKMWRMSGGKKLSFEKNCHLVKTDRDKLEVNCDNLKDARDIKKLLESQFKVWDFEVQLLFNTRQYEIIGKLRYNDFSDDELADLHVASDIRDFLFNNYGVGFRQEDKPTYVTLCNEDVQTADNEQKHEMIGKVVGSQIPMGKTVYKKSRKFAKKHPKLGVFTLAGVVDKIG